MKDTAYVLRCNDAVECVVTGTRAFAQKTLDGIREAYDRKHYAHLIARYGDDWTGKAERHIRFHYPLRWWISEHRLLTPNAQVQARPCPEGKDVALEPVVGRSPEPRS